MTIAKRVLSYLKEHGVDYQEVVHPHTSFSMETAARAHVSGDALAKGIVVKEGGEYLLLVVPSDYYIELKTLSGLLKRDLEMADEDELGKLFPDCEPGAVPPFGFAYGIRTLWDPNTSLGDQDEVFFEGGDHQVVVCVSGKHFHELMASAERERFSHHI